MGDLVETDPQARAAIEDATKRFAERSPRFAVAVAETPEGKLSFEPGLRGGDETDHLIRQLDTFGTSSPHFADRMMAWLATFARGSGEALPSSQQMNAALAVVDGVRPTNEVEAMLATQLYATNEAALRMLNKAANGGGQEDGTLAVKLLRTFVVQAEALAKIRRGGEQKVRVEHVNVYPGGQAIVGDVTTQLPLPGVPSQDPKGLDRLPQYEPSFSPLADGLGSEMPVLQGRDPRTR